MRWHQPDRRTVSPTFVSRSAPQVWVRYRCMGALGRRAHHSCKACDVKARAYAARLIPYVNRGLLPHIKPMNLKAESAQEAWRVVPLEGAYELSYCDEAGNP